MLPLSSPRSCPTHNTTAHTTDTRVVVDGESHHSRGRWSVRNMGRRLFFLALFAVIATVCLALVDLLYILPRSAPSLSAIKLSLNQSSPAFAAYSAFAFTGHPMTISQVAIQSLSCDVLASWTDSAPIPSAG